MTNAETGRVPLHLPPGLESVALRLAHVDSCIEQMIDLSVRWSNSEPVSLELHRAEGTDRVVVAAIRPAPPLVWLLFSDAINQLRACLDNVVWHLVESSDGRLSAAAARKVSFPIYDDEKQFGKWVSGVKSAGIASLGSAKIATWRIRTLQPFVDTSSTIPERETPLSDSLTEEAPEHAHALLLLQGYSNHDKHRALALTATSSNHLRLDLPMVAQGSGFRRISVGDVLLSKPAGGPIPLEVNQGMYIERPDPFIGTPAVISELRRLFDYVRGIAVPTLLTGVPVPDALPPWIDLGESSQTVQQRVASGTWETANDRFLVSLPSMLEEAMQRPAIQGRLVEHEVDEICEACGIGGAQEALA